MGAGILLFMFFIGIFLYIKINESAKQVESKQIQFDDLCEQTENQQLATNFISEEEKQHILHLKNNGKKIEAIKMLREVTALNLAQAKQYIDTL